MKLPFEASEGTFGFKRGKVLDGRYRLDREIGSGAQAVVFEATHLTLQQPVAIKVIGAHGDDKRERFLREARVAAVIRHRNVVSLTDFGVADGYPFLVMELLEGTSLADRFTEGPSLGLADIIRLVARLLSGLAAVHDAGIVHRDLKPENVFLAEDADGSMPKLVDFGVARTLAAQTDLPSVLETTEGLVAGTPQYMSPEQARGLRSVDHRSDIWAIGVMLYELLTGTLPFDGEAPGDVIVQLVGCEPVPLEDLRPDLGDPLCAVVHTAMEKLPEDRFQSARAMRKALLEATAKTASAASSARPRPIHIGTHSELPPIEPRALYAAIGDAFEPGDAQVIELTTQDLMEIHSLDSVDSLAARRELPTEAYVEPIPLVSSVSPPAPRGRSRLGIGLAVGGAALVVGLLTVALWPASPESPASSSTGPSSASPPSAGPSRTRAPSPEPEETAEEETVESAAEAERDVEVVLIGVPGGARVLVDGEARSGAVIELPRGEQPVRLEVRQRGFRPFRVDHVPDADGRYLVQLEPVRRASPNPRRGREPSPATPTGTSRPPGLFGDPGF